MANEEMIQKHLDNFLAKIAGETPVDDTIQNSTEFWINKIAEQGGGGGEKLYCHHITSSRQMSSGDGKIAAFSLILINKTAEEFTCDSLAEYLTTLRGKSVCASGYQYRSNAWKHFNNVFISTNGLIFGVFNSDTNQITLYSGNVEGFQDNVIEV